MKKNIVIFFDCHGIVIKQCLELFSSIKKDYDVSFISLNESLTENKSVELTEQKLLNNADIAIIQYIKNDRPFIHHEIIKNYLNESCKVILLPHYVFSGCHHEFILPEIYNIEKTDDELIKIYETITIEDNDIVNNYNNSIIEFNGLFSDIKMTHIMEKYAKKYMMFNSRSYPTNTFFLFLSKEILKFLNIEFVENEFDGYLYNMNNSFATNVRYPILPCVAKILNLEFNVYKRFTFNKLKFSLQVYLLAYKEKKRFLNLRKNKDYCCIKNILNNRKSS
jgi:hypothetical protein